MKKNLISTVALGMILSTTLSVHADNKVNDINGHWAHKEISQFIQNSYANGYEDNTFRPDNQITRAEFVKLVNKYFGFEDKGISNFKDINQKNWYYNDVCIAIKAGYINGYEDNTFRPNNLITREEAAKIIVSIKNQQDDTYDKLNTFPDKHLVSNWAKPYIEGAIENGYLKGDNLKNLRPTSRITRAESVTLLSRIENKVVANPVLDNEDVVKPVVKEQDNNELVQPKIDNKDEYPVLNYHLVSYHLLKGEVWNSKDRINANAFDKNHKPLEVHYEGNVDTNSPGYYTVKVSATDDEGRTTTKEAYVYIEDPSHAKNRHLYPQIISRDLVIKKGSNFDYKMLDASSSDVDGNDISNTITYKGNVDTSKEGRYPVFISAKDSKGLVSTLLVLVYVDDNEYPVNPDNEHPINPDDTLEPPYAKDKNYNGKPFIFIPEVEFNIARGSDWDNTNLDEVLKADAFDKNGKQLKVEYVGYVDTNVPGKYIITAMATDSEGRHSENEVVVFVRSSINRELLPSIEYSSKDIFLKLGDKFDYKMLGATAKDLLGNDISSSIEYSSKVDVNRPGRYPVVITATDSYGNSNSDVVVVYVQ
ncbi:S-layer homology domain-containing protein [Paraclostridium tenue]|uniref:SLH domain-containing protein n=1 Tax=Paraclostridium tenue TaxID=1737 RepID=A0ABP3XKD0_9FIRM